MCLLSRSFVVVLVKPRPTYRQRATSGTSHEHMDNQNVNEKHHKDFVMMLMLHNSVTFILIVLTFLEMLFQEFFHLTYSILPYINSNIDVISTFFVTSNN